MKQISGDLTKDDRREKVGGIPKITPPEAEFRRNQPPRTKMRTGIHGEKEWQGEAE